MFRARTRRLALLLSSIPLVLAVPCSHAETPSGVDWEKARQHWSFVPPQSQPLPRVQDPAWPRSRLDHFILARLEADGLSPASPADSRTVIRRLTFDLTGLPPTPEEVRAFVEDTRPDAYARLVEDLLSRQAFGERMASLWLNLARYAEDQAHQVGSNSSLNYPNAWRYRDWVVAAFNADLPYDAFVRKQLAADLESGAAGTDLAALGFLGLGHKLYARGRLDVQAEEWAEQVDTVTQTFLGLTVACARCHDHKFDPITSRDYHAMAGIFASLKMVNRRPDGKDEDEKVMADKMDPGVLHVVRDAAPKDLPVYDRGNVETPGAVVPRGYLQVLSPGEPLRFQQGSGRAELAAQLTAPTNPLTARVLVNRLWGLFFGQSLAGTPSNFGLMGDRPTHPELLDDLAVRFMSEGWSIKRLVREFVTSATYRQSSLGSAAGQELDPDNRLLSRMTRRRMSVEQWRDAVLAVSGALSREGGPSRPAAAVTGQMKRTLYSQVSRRELDKTLMLFDYPDANVHAPRRSSSTTPTQKLFMLNSPFITTQAALLAARLADEAGPAPEARVRRAYELLFARAPLPEELALAVDFTRTPAGAGPDGWEQFAHALLATNEMLYVD